MQEERTPEADNRASYPDASSSRRWRFERSTRLLGSVGVDTLARSHVAVFGLGGVGSYAAEALARIGVGRLTLVDFDRVCVTNINRQLQALVDTVGASKADLMAARVQAINPDAVVRACNDFYDAHTSARLLTPAPDLLIDCIDNVTAKMHLVASAIAQGIPIVTTLGAAAKLDPTRIRVVPLTDTHTDPLGRALRKHIRRKHPVTDEQLAGVIAVFSDEPVMLPRTEAGHGVLCGVNCVCPGSDNAHHTCKRRHVIYGTAVFVTGAFGMAAASAAVRRILGLDPFSPTLACKECGNVLGQPPARRKAGVRKR